MMDKELVIPHQGREETACQGHQHDADYEISEQPAKECRRDLCPRNEAGHGEAPRTPARASDIIVRKMPKITNPQIPCAPEGWIGIEYPESNERDELLPEICKRPVQTRILEDPDQDPGPDIAACKGSTSSVQTEPHASNDHQDNCCVENRNARCYRVRKYELFGNRHITTDEKEN
jgi:hypothetical protein